MPKSKVNDLKKQLAAAEKEREDNLRASRAKAMKKYLKTTFKRIEIKVRFDTQQDIIDYLATKDSASQYIIELIKKDMENNGR